MYNETGGQYWNPTGIIHYFTQSEFNRILALPIDELPTTIEALLEQNREIAEVIITAMESPDDNRIQRSFRACALAEI